MAGVIDILAGPGGIESGKYNTAPDTGMTVFSRKSAKSGRVLVQAAALSCLADLRRDTQLQLYTHCGP
jgi:hypothetical protein